MSPRKPVDRPGKPPSAVNVYPCDTCGGIAAVRRFRSAQILRTDCDCTTVHLLTSERIRGKPVRYVLPPQKASKQ
jgi:hypothetical protein